MEWKQFHNRENYSLYFNDDDYINMHVMLHDDTILKDFVHSFLTFPKHICVNKIVSYLYRSMFTIINSTYD